MGEYVVHKAFFAFGGFVKTVSFKIFVNSSREVKL
jgi:hypothetical protein